MKYKILLAGKNQTTIDDFFYVMSDNFECMTTTVRSFDIANHIKYFQPDAFVYCMTVETKETIMTLVNALNEVGRKKQKLILIGESEACAEFMRWKPEIVSLVLEKPINANTITEKVINLIKEQKETIELSDEKKAELEKEIEVQEKVTVKREKQEQKISSVNKQILVIDDDPMMLKLIKEELRDEYSVATAVSGKIGLSFLERKNADLILLDYEMPGESGPEVLEKLRANEDTKDIPVVFLTGINDREKIQKVLMMKPQGYLLKPIDHDKLIQTISKVIG